MRSTALEPLRLSFGQEWGLQPMTGWPAHPNQPMLRIPHPSPLNDKVAFGCKTERGRNGQTCQCGPQCWLSGMA